MPEADLDDKADAEEREYLADQETDALRAEIDALTAKLESRKAAEAEVVALEELAAENPDEKTRRELHAARVKAGWTEFAIDATSGVDPRTVIPWAVTREVKTVEEWPGAKTPDPAWLRPTKTVMNHRVCDDGKWRRDVTDEIVVVAVEDLAHLCSIVTRMEDLILYKQGSHGLMRLTIFDQSPA